MLEKVIELYRLGYLHGDLQPNHFIIDSDGRYHLIDLELAVNITKKDTNYRGALVHFVPPETAKGMLLNDKNMPIDPISEIYSFGAVSFFLYTGITPVSYSQDMTNPSYDYSFHDKLSSVAEGRLRSFDQTGAKPFPELESVLGKCLSKNRDERYKSFNQLYKKLNNLV